MKEISSNQAFRLTSPNPLVLVCTEKEDGTSNLAPVSFFMFTSFNPAMVAFALGENKNTGANFERTGRAVIVTPGLSLKEAVMKFGTSSGSKTDKLAEFPVPVKRLEGCSIQIPEDVRTAFTVSLDGTMQTGSHTLYSCRVDKIYGDDSRAALFAWKGYAAAEPSDYNLYSRVSIRKYQDRPVEKEKTEAMLRAAMQAPSAANQQPWEFYVVTDKEKLEALSGVSPYAGMTKDAPAAIVSAYRKNCNVPPYAEIDMSIAMENLWIETDAQGLGGVWLGIAPLEERMKAVEEILDIPDTLRAFAIFPYGYPAEEKKQQDRFDKSRIHYVE